MERRVNQKDQLPVHKEVTKISDGKYSNGKMKETWLVDVFQLALDAIIVFNHLEGKIVDVNPAFCSIMKQEQSSIIGKTLQDLVPFEKHYKLKRQQMLLDQVGKAKGVLPFKTPNGLVYFEIITTQQPGTLLNISIMRDITHKAIMEKNSNENNYFLKELFLEAMDGIILWDISGNVITANAAACNIFECRHHTLVGENFRNLTNVGENRLNELIEEIKQMGAVKSQISLRIPNGKEKNIEFTCKTHSIEGYIITIFRDISNRYQMEKDLQESEQKFRRIFEGSMDGLILWNDELRIVDINCAAEKMFGLSKDKLMGRLILEFFADKDEQKQEVIHHIGQVLVNEKHSGSLIMDTMDGQKRHYDYSSKREIIEGLNFTVIKDVSEKVKMQEQLRKSDRLNVIGELAAGIAHEIRNPMTALKGFIQLLESSIKAEHHMYYSVITSELARIDSIINEFLILAKPQAIRYLEMDVNQIMKETVDLLNAQAALYNVQFKTDYDSAIPPLYCEPNQLKKVFINIIKNAIEVMPDGGNITISTEKINDRQIMISIMDEGTGIPKDRIKKIGEPFYTTKERGTGLGLMVSYKIIEEHHGLIQIESEEGEGTTFHVTLPLDLKEDHKQAKNTS